MVVVGMLARSPKPGVLPRAEMTASIAELRVFWRVLAALPKAVAISSNAFSTYLTIYVEKIR